MEDLAGFLGFSATLVMAWHAFLDFLVYLPTHDLFLSPIIVFWAFTTYALINRFGNGKCLGF